MPHESTVPQRGVAMHTTSRLSLVLVQLVISTPVIGEHGRPTTERRCVLATPAKVSFAAFLLYPPHARRAAHEDRAVSPVIFIYLFHYAMFLVTYTATHFRVVRTCGVILVAALCRRWPLYLAWRAFLHIRHSRILPCFVRTTFSGVNACPRAQLVGLFSLHCWK